MDREQISRREGKLDRKGNDWNRNKCNEKKKVQVLKEKRKRKLKKKEREECQGSERKRKKALKKKEGVYINWSVKIKQAIKKNICESYFTEPVKQNNS